METRARRILLAAVPNFVEIVAARLQTVMDNLPDVDAKELSALTHYPSWELSLNRLRTLRAFLEDCDQLLTADPQTDKDPSYEPILHPTIQTLDSILGRSTLGSSICWNLRETLLFCYVLLQECVNEPPLPPTEQPE